MTPFDDEVERRPSDPAMPSVTMRSSIHPEGVRVILERARTTPSIRPAHVAGGEGLRAAIAAQRRGAPPAASVERVTVEVRIGTRTEMVALGLDGTRLLVASSDGGGESSPFAQAALAWLDAGEGADGEGARAPAMAAALSMPVLRAVGADLCTAIARGGVRAGTTPAVLEALDRIASEPRGAVPLVRARWLARVGAALGAHDADLVARLVAPGPPPIASTAVETAIDRSYVEVAREALPGDEGTTIERRHLVDVGSGEVLLEERALSDAGASLGPCPRLCAVGYGEIFAGAPRRIIVSQYAVVPEVVTEHWDRVLGCAVPLALASSRALSAIAARGDAEPASLVLGAALDEAGVADDAGTRYPFLESDVAQFAASALLGAAKREQIRWVLVRFEAERGRVGVVPLACGWQSGDGWRHLRLR